MCCVCRHKGTGIHVCSRVYEGVGILGFPVALLRIQSLLLGVSVLAQSPAPYEILSTIPPYSGHPFPLP